MANWKTRCPFKLISRVRKIRRFALLMQNISQFCSSFETKIWINIFWPSMYLHQINELVFLVVMMMALLMLFALIIFSHLKFDLIVRLDPFFFFDRKPFSVTGNLATLGSYSFCPFLDKKGHSLLKTKYLVKITVILGNIDTSFLV